MDDREMRYQNDEIDILLLARKMLSHKALMVVSLIVGIVAALVWGFLFYSPSCDFSTSYIPNISSNSTFSNIYGIQYKLPEELVAKINHPDTATAFLLDRGIGEDELSGKAFLKPLSTKYEKGFLTISAEGLGEEKLSLYVDYVTGNIDDYNEEYRDVVLKELEFAREAIQEELEVIQKSVFESDATNSSNYSYSITLKDRLKIIDIQERAIEEGALKIYSNFDVEKTSSRAKTMIIIVLAFVFVGAFVDFCICFFDSRIYFSEEISNVPPIRKRLLSCIPLYRDENVSRKECVNIASILPQNVSSVVVSEISPNAGAAKIADGLKAVSSGLDVKYNGSLINDGDILSRASECDANLIVVRVGIDTVDQVMNIIWDCKIKGVDNYYFVLNGADPSDKMVTLFEDKSHYVKYPFYSFRTLRQHYEHYYKKV